jgi:hypothetical protein
MDFTIQTPKSDQRVPANIAHALGLGLPEIDTSERSLHIVANGPTAREFFRHRFFGDTMALNGALGVFVDHGRAPTYWAGCDSQEELAGFLKEAPPTTTYLVASRCHPAVFDRLRNHDVRLWHVSDYPAAGKRRVPCAVSITLCAAMLAQRLGYRRLDMWGWDCCFSGSSLEDVGEHHAGQGELSATPEPIEIEIDDEPERYISTSTWMCEISDAQGILPVLRWCGTDVVIHGRSLISAIIPEFGEQELNRKAA